MLDETTRTQPSRFELELWIDGRRWSYGFACTRARVHAEWLLVGDGTSESEVFRRQGGEEEESFSIGDGIALTAQRRHFWEFTAEGTRPNQLFLAEARERNVGELSPLLVELVDGFTWVPAGFSMKSLPRMLLRHPPLLECVSSLMRELGTGVTQVELAFDTPSDPDWANRLQDLSVGGMESDKEQFFTDLGEEPSLRIRFRHGIKDGGAVALEAAAESDGTLRLLQLSPVLFMLTSSRRAVLIDELDHSLHTLLCRSLLERFFASDSEGAGQLLFTTHDTNLLDLTLMPPDSIWFVEKERGGGSTLYSLAEFKPEQLERLGGDLEKGYLNGRFGAIPFLGDPRRLGWAKTKAS